MFVSFSLFYFLDYSSIYLHLCKVPNSFYFPFTVLLLTTAHYNNLCFSGISLSSHLRPLFLFFLLCVVPLIFCSLYVYRYLLWTGAFYRGGFFLNFDLASSDKDESMSLAVVNDTICKLTQQDIIPLLSLHLQR